MQAIGTLFTNELHNIIYIDDMLKSFLGYTNENIGRLIGESVVNILEINYQQYIDIIQPVMAESGLHKFEMSLAIDGTLYPIIADALVNYQDKSLFMGIDYNFYLNSAAIPVSEPMISTDLQARVNVSDDMNRELIRLYSQQQINQILNATAMMMGDRMVHNLQQVIQATAKQNQWHVDIDKQTIKLADSNPLQASEALLYKTTAYAFKLVGQNILLPYIERVNKKTNNNVFNIIPENWYGNF